MNHFIRIWLGAAAALAIGCGGVTSEDDGDGSGGADAGSGEQSDGAAADAAPLCAVAARYDVLSGDDDSATAGGAVDTGLFAFVGLGDGDLFKVTFAPGFEPFLGADGVADPQNGTGTQDDLVVPGTIPITGVQLAYATAGVAVEIFGNVSGETFEQQYYATGGSVRLDSVDGQLAFAVEEISLEHVQIDPETLEQTVDPSGCTTAVGSGDVLVTIQIDP